MPKFPFLILAVILISCNQLPPPTKSIPSKAKLAEKIYPYYERELEKEFPNTELSIEGYLRGKRQVQEDIRSELTKSANGFDQPWTVQGPGNIGARINALAVNPENENIIFVGYSGGGLWRTVNGGQTWESVFDTEIFNSISEITIDPESTNTIYIGTGDPNVPGRTFIGEGIYKSSDNGDTWSHLGLTEQRIISKIRIHPDNSEIMYAGSMGLPFTKNDSRGLYRSMNGGADWDKIFYLSDSTGVSDVLVNPEKPEIINVATWDRVRNDSVSLVDGKGSGIFVSQNSGQTWDRAVGIPDTILCRTGLAYCKSQPANVYAITVDTSHYVSAIYRSRDYGVTFSEINTSMLRDYGVGAGFAWYFGKIEVDPNNPDHIYVLEVDLWETYDNGETWLEATPPWWTYEVHADKHDLHITDEGRLYLATDGGLYRGQSGSPEFWEDLEDIPTTQFYRVGYNPHRPDLYYGGAQDNGTTAGNIDNILWWPRILGGDGFQPVFNPIDPDHWFAEVQRGSIRMTTNGGEDFTRATEGLNGNMNWDMQYIMSPHNHNTMYTGTDSVYIALNSYDPVWTPISGNLTEGGFPTSLNVSITSIDESIIRPGLIYVGTSNGLIYVQGAGIDWRKISDITELPLRYITSVKASPSYEGTAFVTMSGYRDNDFYPRVFRTDIFGEDWIDISSNLPDIAINDILIIPDTDDRILFVATDGGIYGSVNRGQEWTRLGLGMPNIVCYDMDYNVAKQELVVATFGRSIMSYPLAELIEDDVSTKDITEQSFSIYPNPTSDYLNFDFRKNSDLTNNFSYEIMSADGLLLQSGTEESRIAVSGLAAGSYIITVTKGSERYSQTFVKE